MVTKIYSKSTELPMMDENNFFHSRKLFSLCENAPGQKPLMVTVETDEGKVVSHMLATIRYRTSWFPPFLDMHCYILGEGVYEEETLEKEELFGMMLKAVNKKMSKRVMYIEVTNLSHKMFGYREFKKNAYFPVHWMSIHNSLHSHTPEERISEKMQRRIDRAYARGVTTQEVSSEEDLREFFRLIKRHNILKPKRFIPSNEFFKGICDSGNGRLFVTKYKEHVIGCSACVYSQGNAYLWYAAYLRKSYARLHPDILTIWHAIKFAHEKGYQHICFMDVGLPFRKNPFREFILRFGGKPASTSRWFHCTIKWINSLLSWIYRD